MVNNTHGFTGTFFVIEISYPEIRVCQGLAIKTISNNRAEFETCFLETIDQFGLHKGSCFIWACDNGLLKIVKALVPRYIYASYHASVGLVDAARIGNLDIVKYLIEHGADIFTRGNQPYREALKNDHENVMRYLESLDPTLTPERYTIWTPPFD